MAFIKGYKSYIIATLMVLVGVVNVLAGDMSLMDLLNDPNVYLILNGLGLAAVRNALK